MVKIMIILLTMTTTIIAVVVGVVEGEIRMIGTTVTVAEVIA